MARLKLYFTYDGTHFHGWQRQKNTPHTIQEVLEGKLAMIANSRVTLMASGRTDAGVHARIQVAHADVPDTLLRLTVREAGWDDSRLKQSLNSMLPPDIRVLLIERAGDEFHALRDVEKKTYVYLIDSGPVQWPELRDYAWHLRLPLDWDAMEKATAALPGEHDFKAFAAADASTNTTIRTLFEARWGTVRWGGIGMHADLRALRVTGTGFLKNMVRSIVGTLVHIGNRKAGPDLVPRLLASRDRKQAGPTAPARGLWLWDIRYPEGS